MVGNSFEARNVSRFIEQDASSNPVMIDETSVRSKCICVALNEYNGSSVLAHSERQLTCKKRITFFYNAWLVESFQIDETAV